MIIEERKAGETGREYAYRVIKKNIICLEFAPGMMLSEKEIADQLDLSRTPVREALIELAKTKIVEVLPQRGSRVAYIDYALVEEAYFARVTLERAIIRLVCDIRTDEDIKVLSDNIGLQEYYLKVRDRVKLSELDNEFHKQLFRMAYKAQVYEMVRSLCIHFDRVRDLSIVAVKDLKTVDDHKKILEAIKNRDKETAEELITYHIGRFRLDEESVRKAYSEYFKDRCPDDVEENGAVSNG